MQKPKNDAPGGDIRQIILWALVITSLLLNLALIVEITALRSDGIQAARLTRQLLTAVNSLTIEGRISGEELIAIDAELPLNEAIAVPISGVAPINTRVTVPVDAGLLGTINLEIPIVAELPLTINAQANLDTTLDLTTVVPLQLDIPVVVALGETPLGGVMVELDAALAALEAEMRQPPLVGALVEVIDRINPSPTPTAAPSTPTPYLATAAP